MSSNHGLRGLVRNATVVDSTFQAQNQQQQQHPAAPSGFKQEDFGDLLGHNRNPNMGMVIRQRKGGRDKADETQEQQPRKLSVAQRPDREVAGPGIQDPATIGMQKGNDDAREMPLLLAQRRRGKDNRNNSKEARQMRKDTKDKFSKAAKRLALVRILMPAFDPHKYPHGRISRAMLQHSGTDWMSRTLLMHTYVSVVQAIVRGIFVRNWFRASLVEASARISDRDYFKRLASIGACTRSTAVDSMDVLAQQVREEEEEDAMDYIRRNRRAGDVSLDYEELKIVGHRFTRLGKEKAASGHAYQEMTKHVIVSGQSRRKAKVTLVTDTIFIPPSVHCNPFQQRTFMTAKQMARHMRTASIGTSKKKNFPYTVVADVRTPHKQEDKNNFVRSVRPPSTDSSLSDWTDCDEEEFDNLAVKPAPAYQNDDEQRMVGEQKVLQHGTYMGRGADMKPTDRRMDHLDRQVKNVRLKYEVPFDPAEMGLPGDLVRDMLMLRLAKKQEQLGVPIYKAVSPHRVA
eukprot:jgi/Ulvmu1/3077/UM015_0117.1